MSCTLATIAACFSFSNLYVDTGISFQDRRTAEIATIEQFRGYDGSLLGSTMYTDRAANPYGRFALGYALDMRSIVVAIEGTHVSSLATSHDRGINSLEVRARWYPFRR